MADVDVVVVGAGFGGLIAARELTARGYSAAILEKDGHSGGRVHTEQREGAYLEHGGIFHTHGYRTLRALIDELGLTDDVAPTATGFHSGVRRGGDWRHVDYGSVTGPLLTTALGLKDKLSILRSAVPALLARPSDLADLTPMASFDTKAVSDGLTEAAATYFTAGPHEFLWGTPSDRISFAMLALQLHVFRGELREVRGGMSRVVDGIATGLDVRHGTTVTGIASVEDGVEVTVEGSAEPLGARAAVLACPADVAARLWPDAPAAVADWLHSVDYSRIDYVYLRTRTSLELRADGKAVGMEVVTSPEVGDSTLGGIYVANAWTSDGGGLLLVTAAHAAHAENLSDDELADRLQADTEKLHPEIVGQVTERVVMRHQPYTPVVAPGSVKRLASVRSLLPSRRVDLAGDHMSAPWVEGAIRSGQQAAERVAASLR